MKKSFSSNPKPYDRLSKINNLLLSELNKILLKQGDLSYSDDKKDYMLSITKVETTRDLKTAKVYFLVIPEKHLAGARTKLNKKAGRIQQLLSKNILTKSKPRISFVYDQGQSNSFAVEKILNQVSKNDKKDTDLKE